MIAVVSLAAGGYLVSRRAPDEAGGPAQVNNEELLLPAGTEAGYVDAAACAGCHQDVWETYGQTGMGRSLARPRSELVLADSEAPVHFYHEASDRHYEVYERDGRFYQRRHQTGMDSEQINVVEKPIDFVLGSGNHARTFLHRSPDGRIFELPLAWYAEDGGYWAMNPSYDRPDHPGFRREILQECLFCHTGYPEIAPGSDRTGSEPRFPGNIPEGIDCQRCHGPGREHIAAVERGDSEAIARSILNPSQLPPEAQLELCMQCHLETTSTRLPHAILRLDRGAFSYRAGEPLANYALHFDHAPGTGHDDKFEIAHHAYRLRKSACFVESGGRLTCTTCHDPHETPRGEAAVAKYTSICRDCHAGQLEKPIAGKRHADAGNCLDCHMPKRRTDDVVHVVMTDHYIQRRKPARDLLAPLKERHDSGSTAYHGPVVPYYPRELAATPKGELYEAMAQVKQFSNLEEGIPRLEAALEKYRPDEAGFYFELAEAYVQTGHLDKAIRRYEDAATRNPKLRAAWSGLGRTLSKSGQHERGAEALRKALATGSQNATFLNDLGLIYLRQGRNSEAVAAFREAIRSDPDFAEAHSNLGGALSQGGDAAGAEQSYRSAIRLQPDFAGAHRNLANLLSGRANFREAEHHFRKAISHDSSSADAHHEYAVTLARMERYREARAQFDAAVRLNPGFARAHSGLADMLALEGLTSRAIEHYERALAIDAAMDDAHLGLGSALASQARFAEAITHLDVAARSSEPSIRQAANQALQAVHRAGMTP